MKKLLSLLMIPILWVQSHTSVAAAQTTQSKVDSDTISALNPEMKAFCPPPTIPVLNVDFDRIDEFLEAVAACLDTTLNRRMEHDCAFEIWEKYMICGQPEDGNHSQTNPRNGIPPISSNVDI